MLMGRMITWDSTTCKLPLWPKQLLVITLSALAES